MERKIYQGVKRDMTSEVRGLSFWLHGFSINFHPLSLDTLKKEWYTFPKSFKKLGFEKGNRRKVDAKPRGQID